MPQTQQKNQQDCIDKAYNEVITAINSAPKLDSAMGKAGSLTKFGKDFLDGYLDAGPKGTTVASVAFFAASAAGKIPSPWSFFNPFSIGRIVAGVGNILQNPSNPLGDAIQANREYVNQAMQNYNKALKDCKNAK